MKRYLLLSACVAALLPSSLLAIEIEGFTEPFRTIKVAAEEMGVLSEVAVIEGQQVKQGQKLAALSDDVLQAQIAMARQELQSTGKRRSAAAEVKLRQARAEKLRFLTRQGAARQEEVVRAEADLEIAQARLQSVEEEIAIKRLELAKLQVQRKRRIIMSPIDGVVTKVNKQPGEFVAPNDPRVVQLVQLHVIFAKFSIASSEARQLSIGKKATVLVGLAKKPVSGTIHYIAPVTDAESGTVEVKIRIENPNGQVRSGESCRWSPS